MSRTGITLCLFYALIIIICFVLAYLSKGDFKGQYIFLQLPLSFQLAGLNAIGLLSILKGFSWVGIYIVIGVPSFLLLYFVGRAIDAPKSDHSNN